MHESMTPSYAAVSASLSHELGHVAYNVGKGPPGNPLLKALIKNDGSYAYLLLNFLATPATSASISKDALEL
jgi:hypothetical protein